MSILKDRLVMDKFYQSQNMLVKLGKNREKVKFHSLCVIAGTGQPHLT